jgi:hypothetical protein
LKGLYADKSKEIAIGNLLERMENNMKTNSTLGDEQE